MNQIKIEKITKDMLEEFWYLHYNYLIDDEIILDEEDKEYFKSDEYRNILESHMDFNKNKHYFIYFIKDYKRIGAASYSIYGDENMKCFILDYWIFKEYRNQNLGHLCFLKLEEEVKKLKASCYEINATKENSIRFWKSLGFIENGFDEYDIPLFIKKIN